MGMQSAGLANDLDHPAPDLTDIVSSLHHASAFLATFARLGLENRQPFQNAELAQKLYDAATEIESLRRDRGQLTEQLHAIRTQVDFCRTMIREIVETSAKEPTCSCGELGRRALTTLRHLGYAQ